VTKSPFIIAEIGVNHDGSVDRALELVGIARRCGADAVKLQVFRAARLMNPAATFADYQKDRVADANPIAMLERYELPETDMARVVAAIAAAGMTPLATPFSLEDVSTIQRLDLPLIKIASPDLVNYVLLGAAAQLRKPLLLSTGAATLDEVTESVAWLKHWNASFALLHCISSYPTPPAETNLGWIRDLASLFNVPIGYSDHSTEVITGALAVAAGATILERHLTYDKLAQGPDHSASSDPAEFAEYVRLARLAHDMIGAGPKRVLPIERDVRTVSRQSLVTARDLPAGHVIESSDLKTQRPGTGVPAKSLPTIVGRRTTRFLPANHLLDPSDFA
jgi:sialic acid synthase SpsE